MSRACVSAAGFPGWTGEEGPLAAAKAGEARDQLRRHERPDDSDDDGFFEQSSLGDSDTSRHDDCAMPLPATATATAGHATVSRRGATRETATDSVQHFLRDTDGRNSK